MQGFSQVNAGDYFPQEIANQITNAYSKMGGAQAEIEYKREQEEERKRQQKKMLKNMGIMLGATALTGGAAALAAPGALAGGLGAGLGTFGKGALGAFTGAGSVAPGVKGLAGGLNTVAGALGGQATSSLMGGAMGAMGGGGAGGGMMGGAAGMGGGGMDAGQMAMGALGSYLKDSQAANKSNRILEGTLTDPTVRAALYPGVGQEQVDALLKYKKDNFGNIEGAQFLQQTLPMLSRVGAGNVDFDRQMQMQDRRNEPTYARGIAELAGSRGGGGYTPLPPVDFTQFGGLPPAQQQQNYGGAWGGAPYR